MADPYVALGLKAIPYAIDHYPQVYHPIKRKVQKMRRRSQHAVSDDVAIHGGWKPDDGGLVLKKRSEVASDEEIVETVPRRYTNNRQLVRRTSSLDRIGYGGRDGRSDKRVGAYRGGNASDSEGSVPPRSRVSAKSRGRGKSTSGRGGRHSSSSSSSDLGSSTDDEKKCKNMARKKWLTGGLAAVATVHAAAKVYSSMEAHDKRVEKVVKGEMSPQEAQKKKMQARWQDAAAIGIAALGIKSAMSEWSEVQEQQHEYQELLESRQERHRRRMERERRRAKEDAERRRQGYDSGDDRRSRRDLPKLKYLPRTIQAQNDEPTESERQNREQDPQGKRPGLRKRDVAKDHINLLGEIAEEFLH